MQHVLPFEWHTATSVGPLVSSIHDQNKAYDSFLPPSSPPPFRERKEAYRFPSISSKVYVATGSVEFEAEYA